MHIYFLTGPLKGKGFAIKNGLVLSRSQQKKEDIEIKEPKASNPHAKIIKKKGKFYLKDLDSKNGTYFKDKIDDYFLLKIDVQFRIGKTCFKVKKSPPIQKPWNEQLALILKKLEIKDKPKHLSLICPALILYFKSGVQKGKKWTLHYGPRHIGPASLDLTILEKTAPDICFSVFPNRSSALFKTIYPDKVSINDKSFSKKILKTGDVIIFSNTLIEISYEEK